MTSTLDVGRKLVALCREGKNLEAVNSLYAPDVISIDAHGDESMPARMQGIEAVRRKNQWWFENNTLHGNEVNGPFPHGDRFIVHFKGEVTPGVGPMAGKRMSFEEAGLYTVRDGKIVQEEFFYHMG